MMERVPIKLPPVFEATILMEPVGKGRPRVVIQKGRARTYTPEETAVAEMLIRASLWNEWQKTHIFFDAGTPLAMELIFYMSKPKSVKRRYPTVKPDWDNLGKLTSDSLEKFLFENDAQIVDVKLSKRYVGGGELPRIYIRVRELEG